MQTNKEYFSHIDNLTSFNQSRKLAKSSGHFNFLNLMTFTGPQVLIDFLIWSVSDTIASGKMKVSDILADLVRLASAFEMPMTIGAMPSYADIDEDDGYID